MLMKHAPVPLALAFGFFAAAQAANAPTPPAELVVCSRMPEREERLNCYDARMAALLAASSPAPAAAPAAVAAPKSEPARVASVPAPPSAVPPPAPSAEQRFGSEDLSLAARAKVEKPDNVLLSTITSIREVRPKLWIIVLGNGQIWMQQGTQITMFFRAGYDVRIEKGLLGDYRMSSAQIGEKNMVKITRIQ
jgi:hypothetical protein